MRRQTERARIPLLASKLSPPLASAHQVVRQAVCDRLAAEPAPPLCLVRAPAGFGKTTVMAQAHARLQRGGLATAWLTLDAADNDVSRFLPCLATALGDLAPRMTALPAADDDGELALRLMDALNTLDRPFALFLDDFETVQNSTVLGLVRELIDHLPARGRIIIGSRSVPDLGFARLRAQGALLEVEPEDLRFSLEETRQFLCNHRGLALGETNLGKLHAGTEGWAAALWLASLALERRQDTARFIDEFSGSSAAIADYLAEDVLAHLPPDQQGFLLRTSILNQLTPDLCNAVTGRADSADVLRMLEQDNLFLVPQDDQRRWYRYHSLFADFLRARLDQILPDEVAGLHRRAADWFRANDRPVPTIEHALAAGDHELAMPLLATHAERLLTQSRFRLLARWLDGIPTAQLMRYPVLRLIHVWATAYSRGYADAMRLLESIDPATLQDSAAQAHYLAVRPTLFVLMDQPERGYAIGKVSLQQLPPEPGFPYSMLTNSLAYLAMTLGHHQEARQLLEESRRTQAAGGGLFNTVYSESVEAVIDLLQGRLRRAMPRLRLATGDAATSESGAARGNMVAGIPLAELLYEADACDQAEHLLNVYLPLVRGVRLPGQLISGHVVLSRLAARRGDKAQAHQILTELEHLGHGSQLPRVVASARLERARLYLVDGDLAAASAEVAHARDRALWRRIAAYSQLGNDAETLTLARLRLLVAGRQPQRAIAVLQRALDDALRGQRLRRALKLRLLLATALHRSGETQRAEQVLDLALEQAGREGFIRTFVDEGAPTAALVTSRLAALAAGVAGPALPADFVQSLGKALGMPEADPAAVITPAEGTLVESLTPREQKVLELLAEGRTNRAMAARLFISETTVRTHLRNINTKLGACNRTEAVAISRRLGLIT